MADKTQRDKVKNHLDAARDWLGSASGALEKREDVKSELDLMLAEAELARAREMKDSPAGDSRLRSRSRIVRKAMKYAPLLAALAVAAVWMRFSAVTMPVKPTPPTPPTVARPVMPQAAKPKVEKQEALSPNKEGETGYAQPQPDETKKEPAEEKPVAPSPGVVTEGKQPQEEKTEVPGVGEQESPATTDRSVPDSSTQRMMLEAAKILRQTK